MSNGLLPARRARQQKARSGLSGTGSILALMTVVLLVLAAPPQEACAAAGLTTLYHFIGPDGAYPQRAWPWGWTETLAAAPDASLQSSRSGIGLAVWK
jgi:hypothetical protein